MDLINEKNNKGLNALIVVGSAAGVAKCMKKMDDLGAKLTFVCSLVSFFSAAQEINEHVGEIRSVDDFSL